MVNTVDYFNNNFSKETGISFNGTSSNYRKSKNINSSQYNVKFHYEFWYTGGKLYASIHTDHKCISLECENLQGKILSLQDVIQKKLDSHLKISPIIVQKLGGGIGSIDSHTLNIECVYSEKVNAKIMKVIIDITKMVKL